MLDHLDPPTAFVPSPEFRRGVEERAKRHRRRRRGTVLAAAIVPVALLVAVVLPAVRDLSRVRRVTIHSLGTDPSTSTASLTPAPPASATSVNIVLVGTDAGVGQAERGVVGVRADSIVLLSIDRAAASVRVRSLSRDLWVVPPGGGAAAKLAALWAAGPDGFVATVAELTATRIDHYVALDMDGFVAISDALGGVRVPFAASSRDLSSGFTAEGGCQDLHGDRLLAYLRSRHLQTSTDGGRNWTADPSADIGRQARQRDVLARTLVALGHAGPTDARALLAAAAGHLTIDRGLSLSVIDDFGDAVRTLTLDDQGTLPATGAVVDGQAVLVPVRDPAAASSTDVAATATASAFVPHGSC